MPKINEKNIIIALGDFGSGVNLLKNILLFGNNVDFPISIDNKLKYFLDKIYPNNLQNNLENWLSYEFKLRDPLVLKYGVDISNNYTNINTDQVIKISQNLKIIFLCHWPDIADQLKIQYPNIKIVSLYPKTQDELLWQTKTYIDKIGIKKLQNFTFFNNIENEKQKFIENNGEEEYYKLNVLNMFEILDKRSESYQQDDYISIPIGDLLKDTIDETVVLIENQFDVDIDLKSANIIHQRWKELHKPLNEIHDYLWFEKVYNSPKYNAKAE